MDSVGQGSVGQDWDRLEEALRSERWDFRSIEGIAGEIGFPRTGRGRAPPPSGSGPSWRRRVEVDVPVPEPHRQVVIRALHELMERPERAALARLHLHRHQAVAVPVQVVHLGGGAGLLPHPAARLVVAA